MSDERTVTVVEIAGEEYTIRTEASPEYTLECARAVDEAITEIMTRGALVEAHKAAILAALALADQLFQARGELEAMRDEMTTRATRLVAEIQTRLTAGDLASPE